MTPARGATLQRAVSDLADLDVNYEPSEVGPRGWTTDEHVHLLGTEAPGDPVPDGPWARARDLVEDYDFTPPELLRAVYARDTALLGRDILLDGRFGPVRFLMGVRITSIVDEGEEADADWRIWGWGYETLQGHLQRGRVVYRVAKHRETGRVEFRADVRWQPHPRLGPVLGLGWRLFGRHEQLRFYRRIGGRLRDRVVEHPDEGRRDRAADAGDGLVYVPTDAPASRLGRVRPRWFHPVRDAGARRVRTPVADRPEGS
ncbi:MAG: hypothetical protein QOJ30_6344 [Pseudonocardiales bacterium]|nr:hypothetical protein [Pseudonocardiales bacterium]